MPYFLALDAGGTKTACLLASQDRILARASTGSIKLTRVSQPEATTRLHALLAEVSAAANIPLTRITRTCIGLAGLSNPAVRTWATQALASAVSGELLLLTDAEIALDAAFPGAPGILVIAGTGSIAIARALSGVLHHAGGWGPILGDEGSGLWIGLQSLRAALHARDREIATPTPEATHYPIPPLPGVPSMSASPSSVGSTEPSPSAQLLTAVQHHWNLPSLPALIELGNRNPPPDFAALAPLVARLAAAGNPIAAAILHQAGVHLADQVALVIQKMTSRDLGAPSMTVLSSWMGSQSSFSIAFTGSILIHIPAVRDSMIATLALILPAALTLPAARVHPNPVDPLQGALYRAQQP